MADTTTTCSLLKPEIGGAFVNHNYSESRLIGFWRICAFFALGPLILPVFMGYALATRLKSRGWDGGWRKKVGMPLFIAFSVLNTVANWTLCSVLFTDWPREFHVSDRLRRLKSHPDPAKRELADMMGGFLNSQDAGHY